MDNCIRMKKNILTTQLFKSDNAFRYAAPRAERMNINQHMNKYMRISLFHHIKLLVLSPLSFVVTRGCGYDSPFLTL